MECKPIADWHLNDLSCTVLARTYHYIFCPKRLNTCWIKNVPLMKSRGILWTFVQFYNLDMVNNAHLKGVILEVKEVWRWLFLALLVKNRASSAENIIQKKSLTLEINDLVHGMGAWFLAIHIMIPLLKMFK